MARKVFISLCVKYTNAFVFFFRKLWEPSLFKNKPRKGTVRKLPVFPSRWRDNNSSHLITRVSCLWRLRFQFRPSGALPGPEPYYNFIKTKTPETTHSSDWSSCVSVTSAELNETIILIYLVVETQTQPAYPRQWKAFSLRAFAMSWHNLVAYNKT